MALERPESYVMKPQREGGGTFKVVRSTEKIWGVGYLCTVLVLEIKTKIALMAN